MNKYRGGKQGSRREKNGAPRQGSGAGRTAEAAISGLPVAKNEEHILTIQGMNHDGEGVGRVEGYTLFVAGALPGEKVRVKILHTKKQFGYAKLLDVLEASPDRISAPCPIYDQCGGCQLQHMSYTGQLAWKRQRVVDALERIGKLRVAGSGRAAELAGAADRAEALDMAGTVENAEALDVAGTAGIQPASAAVDHAANPINGANPSGAGDDLSTTGSSSNSLGGAIESSEPAGNAESADASRNAAAPGEGIIVRDTLGMDDPWRYRNKAQVPIGVAEGGLVGGFYARNSHRIIDMETCLIQHEHNDEVVSRVKAIGRELGISAYNEETGRGLLRHVVVKKAFRTGEIMLVLVTSGRDIPHKDEWIGLIREQIADVASICQNVNTKQTNVIFGDETRVLWGRDVIYDYIGDVQFAISARSFYQVNPVQTEVLYGKTVEYAGLTGKETVIDAYCGIGTISLFLAQHADQVYGVEIVKEAIEDARSNAQLNNMNNVKFEVGASEDVIPRWKEQGIEADVIVVDPPRKGCDPRLLATILEMKPERVVYVSCNASTLARDLAVLEEGGYRTVEVTPVDMFPHTVHVESVVVLVKSGIANK